MRKGSHFLMEMATCLLKYLFTAIEERMGEPETELQNVSFEARKL